MIKIVCSTALLSSICLLLSSCDKVKNALDEAVEKMDQPQAATVSVDKVDRPTFKQIINEESRVVLVDFYTDT
ncbi:hypothetical protein JIN82_03265 [Persicirhabdus sediminis]|uniref:Uncharacterized protein n=1 Tax=Persicirhabdus sediminis TaxID=454144 RepID=A0A8J7MCU0_9BACT|nr:hypothetical protein [Persicirhabdus sediminis]